MAEQDGNTFVMVTGWPLMVPAEKLLNDKGIGIVGTSPEPDSAELIAKIEEAQPAAIIVRTGIVDKACFDAASNLRAIAYHGAGYDVIDVDEATRRGIPVFAAPGRNAISVAEHAIGLILALRKQFPLHDHLIRSGGWRPSRPVTGEIHGQTIGLVGLGAIGEHLASLAVAFGMNPVAYDPGRTKPWPDNIGRSETLEELLGMADVVSLHVPLTPQTKGVIGAEALMQMKQGAILINTARGGIVDEPALAEALQSGHLCGAGIDVFDSEPPGADADLCKCDNVILTPHIAGVTPESTLRMSMCCAENVSSFLCSGSAAADDVVNPDWQN